MVTTSDLASISLFESLSDSERQEVAGWFELQTVGEGVRLCGERSCAYSFFILIEGGAVVTKGDATLGNLEAGEFFGEIAILGDGRRSATVTTSSPARLLVMFGTEFRRLEAAHPGIAARIEKVMRRRLAVDD
ncbi:MAG TPA: cyclic nucleotide-binding domain-containing protein [Gaiellaceae bacterium]